MADDIRIWDEEIRDALKSLEEVTVKVGKCGENEDKTKLLTDCDGKIAEIKTSLRRYSNELRHVKDSTSVQKYTERRTVYTDKLSELAVRIKYMRGAEEKSSLIGNIFHQRKSSVDNGNKQGVKLIGESLKVQEATTAALERITVTAKLAKAEAMVVADVLEGQTEQIIGLDDQIELVDKEVNRSLLMVRYLTHRMMADRWIRAFLLILLVSIFTLVLIVALMPSAFKSLIVPDYVAPPSP